MCLVNLCNSIVLPTSFQTGPKGDSIVWLGELNSFPINPVNQNAFYHTGNNITYIYNSATSQWDVMVQSGAGLASAHKILINELNAISYTLNNVSGMDGIRTTSFDPTLEPFTVGSIIEVENFVQVGLANSDVVTRQVTLSVGNTSNNVSSVNLSVFNDVNIGNVSNVKLETRLNIISLTGNNNVRAFSQFTNTDTGVIFSELNQTLLTIDFTQNVYFFTQIITTGGAGAESQAIDYNMLVTRTIK
jgi:hypothetical protein